MKAAEIEKALSAKYTDLMPIHEGASAYAFKAQHITLDRTVFLKVVDFEASEAERSLREARMLVEAVQKSKSTNIVQLYDAELITVSRDEYVCMQAEFVDGESLFAKLGRGPVGQGAAVLLAAGILQGVIDLHHNDLIHRDLKPANVMLDREGKPKVADLGSVARIGSGGLMHSTSRHSALYTPPEAFARSEFSKASDVYQVGMLLYEMANGPLNSKPEHWIQAKDRDQFAAMDNFECAVALNNAIRNRAEKKALLEHGCPLLPVTSKRLRAAIRAATAPDPSQRGTASELRTKLLSLALPNWLAVGDAFVASSWKTFDYRIAPMKKGWSAERAQVDSPTFRKCSGSPAFADATEAAAWVEKL